MKGCIAGWLVALVCGAQAAPVWAQEPPSVAARWNAGAEDCAASRQPPLQVRRLDADTFVLRQDPCVSFEANFLYLLVGHDRALLIDSGAIDDPARMPLASKVMELVAQPGGKRLPLLVAHTHSHSDHRKGDAQFAGMTGVEIVPADEAGVRRFYGLDDWPDGVARVDLGGRIVDVLPAPGHNANHVVFYDESRALLFTGDFLLPGRLTVEGTAVFEKSAQRVAAFVRDRPVSQVLGGHVELDDKGGLYAYGATHHPRERRLELAKADVLALPAALAGFNGFQSRHANFVITHPRHNLALLATGVVLALALAAWALVRWWRRRRARRSMP